MSTSKSGTNDPKSKDLQYSPSSLSTEVKLIPQKDLVGEITDYGYGDRNESPLGFVICSVCSKSEWCRRGVCAKCAAQMSSEG